MKKNVISAVVSSLIVCVLFVLIQSQMTPPTANASSIATESKVKKDKPPPSISTATLEQYPIGTQFPVHPGSTFDVINPNFTVHVSSLSAELTAKNSYDEYLKDTSLGTGSGSNSFHPYEITLHMSGQIEGSYTNGTSKTIAVSFLTNSGNAPSYLKSIDPNGYFELTEKIYSFVPIEIWFSEIYFPFIY